MTVLKVRCPTEKTYVTVWSYSTQCAIAYSRYWYALILAKSYPAWDVQPSCDFTSIPDW
jgi:hypothetical protein